MKNIIKYLSCAAASAIIFIGAATLSIYADNKSSADNAHFVMTDISEKAANPVISDSITTVSTLKTTAAQTTAETSVSTDKEEITKGWNRINGKWYYHNGYQFVTGIYKIDQISYLFADNGALRTGWQTVNYKRYYYDNETHSIVFGWIEHSGNTYYNDNEIGKLSGMQKIGNHTYIFSDEGILQVGLAYYEGHMYYCHEDGKVQYGDQNKTPVKIGNDYYIISPKGYVQRGWQTVNGLRVFYDYNTYKPVYGWLMYQGNYYYIDKAIGKYTGVQYIDSYPYRFNENGILSTGLQSFQSKGKKLTSYFFNNGQRAVDLVVNINNAYYYFDSDGYMYTGWKTIKNKKYYFESDGRMAFGFKTINGGKYYFDNIGVLRTGLQNIEKDIYYFNSNGIMQFNWQTINNKKYYFDAKTGKAFKGWKKINNNNYYFDENGVMATWKYTIGKDTYFFGNDGKMRTGWQSINNNRYNFGNDGKMLTYRHVIDNMNCLFYSSGILATTGNQLIVVTALSQLGQEGGRPYWTWWGFNFRIEWCACFVSWCANACGYTQNGNVPEFISCKVGIDWFKAHNQWKGRNYIPKSGDYIFFDWEPDGVADHIGIVDYYEDGYVYTVEGNSSDVVRKRIYEIKSENIYGFAAPNF